MAVRPYHDCGCGFRHRPEGLKGGPRTIEQDRKWGLLIGMPFSSFGDYREEARACSCKSAGAYPELRHLLRGRRSALGAKDEDYRVSRNRILAQIDNRAVELWQHEVRCYVTDRRRTASWNLTVIQRRLPEELLLLQLPSPHSMRQGNRIRPLNSGRHFKYEGGSVGIGAVKAVNRVIQVSLFPLMADSGRNSSLHSASGGEKDWARIPVAQTGRLPSQIS
jgi:hypothetical protein